MVQYCQWGRQNFLTVGT